jgi:hypothetical protein
MGRPAGATNMSKCLHQGYVPMKRLAAMGLACLLSACQSSPATLLKGPPEKIENFPAMAADLSDCVYRFAQSRRSPYLFDREVRAGNIEFLVTGTAASVSKLPQIELRFITQGETTIVELRENAVGDHELSHDVWTIVEQCSQQQAKPSGSTSTAP